MPTTQTGRTAEFQCKGLGADALLLTGFSGEEGLSQLYEFTIDLQAEEPVDFADVLGKPAVITVGVANDKTRAFQGVITRFSQGGRDQNFINYQAVVVPEAWYLTKRTDSRIFQNLKVPDILKKVFDAAGLKEVGFKLQGSYPERLYCVQYRETDWDFACRLMEEEGIFYFFEHCGKDGAPRDGGAQLVLSDNPSVHPPLPIDAKLIYDQVTGGNREEDRIWSWQKSQEVRTGVIFRRDFHFTAPTQLLDGKKSISGTVKAGTVEHKLTAGGTDKLEQYDAQSDFVVGDAADFKNGERTAGLRLQEESAMSVLVAGESDIGQITSGYKLTLEKHFDADGDYVIATVQHQYTAGQNFRSEGDAEQDYSNSFTCFPADLAYRPPRLTPRPVVHGTQTATVVGPGGDEIFTDEYSRIKVQFHWDREGKNDADSSCWVRVATPWAGEGWGIISIPRIGQEVIVAHEEGDPDRPIVVGSVYNAQQVPPWALPANKTQSGIQSRSSLKGSAANANIFRFEDKKGSEQVLLHAEKNQDIEVENDETHWVGHDRTKTIDNDETTLVKHDRTETVDNNETITVHGARTETVDKDETITIHSNRTETVDKDESISIGGNRKESVGKDESIKIGGSRTENVGKDESIGIAGNRKESVGKNESISISGGRTENVGKDESVGITGGRSVTVGKDDSLGVTGAISVNSGKSISITAADTISLTVGSASIVMKKDGTITITGKDITVNGSGEINAKASKNITMKGQKILQN